MSIKSALLSRVYAPRVKHRLPGRLRMNAPILKKMPPEHEPLFRKLVTLFLLPRGLKDVEVEFITGSILVAYDSEEITEEAVLKWIGTLWRLFSEHFDRLEKIREDQFDTIVSRITPVLEKALKENHSFDKRIRLPEDVWS